MDDDRSFGRQIWEGFTQGLIEGVGLVCRVGPVLLLLWWLVPQIMASLHLTLHFTMG